MKMVGYYAWHTFLNSLKKIFQSTFVVIFVAVIAIGVIFGFSAALVADIVDSKNESQTEYSSEEYSGAEEEQDTDEYAEDDDQFTFEDAQFMQLCFEFGIPVVLIAFLLYGIYGGSKNGSDIFLMADVNFLFTAPLKPQSVLMFRLTFQMVATILGSFYLIFQIPNLRQNMGISWMAIVAVFLAWIFLLLLQKLVSVLSYTLTATYTELKKYVRPLIILIAAIVVVIVGTAYLKSGQNWEQTMACTFGAKWTRMIPLIGWYKGMIMAAVSGNALESLIYGILLVVLMAVMFAGIWRIKADFYEDAFSGAADRENTMIAAKEGRVVNKKERSEKIARNSEMKGWGGSTFFWKEMYNRRRFARFGIFTNTMLTYLAASVLTALFCERILHVSEFTAIAVILAGIAFFRNYGNPIAAETSMNWLLLVPDNPYRKVFAAMGAGTVSCALDVLPALVIGAVLTPEKPWVVFLWFVMIVSMDFMLSTVGMMLEVLFPATALDIVKSMLQLVLKFIMIAVIVIILAVGALLLSLEIGLLLEILFNLILGTVLFIIYPSLLHEGTA